MKIKVICQEKIFEDEKHFPQCHASTVLKLENGDILSAWFAGTHEKHVDVAIWMARKKEGKWSDPIKVADYQGLPCWNPVLFSSQDGKVYLYYKVGENPMLWKTMYLVSEDRGYSWTEPEELVRGDIGGRGPVKNKPIILSDGSWLAPASIEREGKGEWEAFIDISKDQGKTWSKSNMIAVAPDEIKNEGLIQPSLWQSEGDKVHCFIRSSEGFIYRSDSDDNGLTWKEAYNTNIPNNNSGIDLVKMEDNKLALVYNPIGKNWGERSPISLAISKDNGETWSKDFILDHNPEPKDREDGEFSYPAIIADGNRLYITYTWKRKTIAFWEIEV